MYYVIIMAKSITESTSGAAIMSVASISNCRLKKVGEYYGCWYVYYEGDCHVNADHHVPPTLRTNRYLG